MPGAVTIATNMAGRGTDIKLGGNVEMRIATELADIAARGPSATPASRRSRPRSRPNKQKVLAAGGLFVIGTERHESRRIDNQLRGRSGRQGDPGRSLFYLSLEDDLMRIFGSERMDTMLQKLGLKEGEAIVHPWINKALEKAQQKVEARNFDIRKNLLKFDDVMNDQRKVIFEQRIEIMQGEDVAETIDDMRHQVIDDLVVEAHARECLCRAVGRGGPARAPARGHRHRLPRRGLGQGRRHRRRGNPRARHQGGRRALWRQAREIWPGHHEPGREAVPAADPRPLWREHIVTRRTSASGRSICAATASATR